MEKTCSIKWMHIAFIITVSLMYCICSIIVLNPDSDAYFLIANGKYIMENHAVPKINPWVIHDNFNVIVQQPLCSILNYIFYNWKGTVGICILAFIFAVIRNIITFKYITMFCKSKLLIVILQCLSNVVIITGFSTRPYQLTLSIILLEYITLYMFYIQNELSKKQIVAFILTMCFYSLFIANFQSSMLLMLVIIMLPFIVPAVWNIKIAKYYKKNIYIMIVTIPLMMIASLINPNGLDGALYLVKSQEMLKSGISIQECMSPSFKSFYGILIILNIVLITYYIVNKKKESNSILVYTTLGLIFMSCIYVRNIQYLLIPLVQLTSLVLDRKAISIENDKTYKLNAILIGIVYMIVALLTSILILTKTVQDGLDKQEYEQPDAIKYLDKFDKNDITLFTDFNSGNLFEMHGYKVYIDARPELYMKEVNNKEDVLDEYVKLINGKLDMNDFVKKYQFTHLDVIRNTLFDNYLYYNDDYTLVYENNSYRLYESKTFTK